MLLGSIHYGGDIAGMSLRSSQLGTPYKATRSPIETNRREARTDFRSPSHSEPSTDDELDMS